MTRQASLFDQVTANRAGPTSRHAPETSHLAAITNAPRSGTQRGRVLAAIVARGGLTDDEIGRVVRLPGNAVRPRRGELVQGGFVADSGHRRPSVQGNPAVVWEATPKGIAAVSENREAS